MAMFRRLGLGPRIPRERPVPSVYRPLRRAPLDRNALALWGLLHSQIGIGSSARGYARLLQKMAPQLRARHMAAHVQCHAMPLPGRDGVDFPVDSLNRRAIRNIVVLNPPELLAGNIFFPSDLMRDTYVIGYWAWELPYIPDDWRPAFNLVDEVWTCSSFAARAFRDDNVRAGHGRGRAANQPSAAGKRVSVLPHVMEDWAHTPRAQARQVLGLEGDVFTFLSVFDFASGLYRKNPLGVIAAFRAAFGDGPAGPNLVLKYHSGCQYPEHEAQVRAAAAGCPRIRIISSVLSPQDMRHLFDAADCFISLHRSEGFGLNIAEAMMAGLPVICTAYSGNMDFTSAANSLLVDWKPVPLRKDEYFGWQGQSWAEPDLASAAASMRHVVEDQALAQVIGQRARAHVLRALSPEAISEKMLTLLQFSEARCHLGLWSRISAGLRGAWHGSAHGGPSENGRGSTFRRPPVI
ncbi:glycosyltransferase family 4 protein [Xanthobacter sp. TB0139]|uniref:glycosyltransferase family 4 protein n=1 Tax=Xanthobacter sp. TB0139 TaxID=3459178 RepID=UPI0040392FE5